MNYEFYAEDNGLGRQLRQTKWEDGNPVHINVFPNSFADCIMFEDGELLQEKLDSGALSGIFKIVKTYPSIEEMNKDYNGTDVKIGDLVIIASSTEDEDNAKLFVKSDKEYRYIADMSGSQGIQGPRGEQGLKGDKGDIPSIAHLETQVEQCVDNANNNVDIAISKTEDAVKKVNDVTEAFAPNAQDILDIIDMIGGL